MNKAVRVACLQMNSTASVMQNLDFVEQSVCQAKDKGVQLLLLPENFAQMPKTSAGLHIEDTTTTVVQNFLADLSQKTKLHIVAGSIPFKSPGNTQPYTRSIVFDDDGEQSARYDKIHLFDVSLGNGESYRESATYKAGEVAEGECFDLVQCHGLTLGLSICYDLRFPEMYRKLAYQGAQLVTVPAAFTFATGQKHWEVLLRARAIENQIFVMAAGQVGKHENGRQTWGNSMIIDPWGEVVSQFAPLSLDTGLVIADINAAQLTKIRSEFPVLEHSRL